MLRRILVLSVVAATLVAFLSCSGEEAVTGPKSSEKAILSFSLILNPAVTGVIDNTNRTVSLSVPNGTVVTNLVAIIQISPGATVSPESWTVVDYSNPVQFTVTAADGSVAQYTVTVTAVATDAKSLDTFGITGGIDGGVNEIAKTAWAAVPFTTDRTALVPVFTYSGSVVSNGSVRVVSGSTVLDFSSAQQFVVYAADGSAQSYTVTVTNALASTEAKILSFSLLGSAGTVNHIAKTVAVTVPSGSSVSALKPVYTHSSFATVTPDMDTARGFFFSCCVPRRFAERDGDQRLHGDGDCSFRAGSVPEGVLSGL